MQTQEGVGVGASETNEMWQTGQAHRAHDPQEQGMLLRFTAFMASATDPRAGEVPRMDTAPWILPF